MIKKILPYLVLVLLAFGGLNLAKASEVTGNLETGIFGVTKAAPTASPADGNYHSNQSVTLTASGSTAICYTDDGTAPVCATSNSCTAGTKYSSAISLTSSKTIKSVGCYGDGSQGPAGSAAYTLTCSTASVSYGSVGAYPGCAITCNSGYTLSGSSCVASGAGSPGDGGLYGGGGGSYTPTAPAMPTTTTGQVTATATAGGKTTLTTTDNTTVTVQLPANAVSANTVVTITQVDKTAAAVSGEVAAIPTTMIMVGNSIYTFTAMSGTTNITTFNQNITLTFTYTDAQIAGLSESALKVYYWNTTTLAWSPLFTTVNASTNTLTVTTNHFTNFAIFGSQGQNIPEGALIRAIGDIDVFVVKYMGDKQFKRLILSPSVFNSYQHLKWENVLDVDKSVIDSYITSELVRAVGDLKVYKLYPAGDTGQKRWIKTAEAFNRLNYDWDSIYEINAVDRNSYVTGTAIE